MNHDLTRGPVWKALLNFVLPFLAASILQFLYSVVDMIVVGRFADAAAISAVNTAGQTMQLVTTIVQGIATGGTVLIGQYIGGRNSDGVSKTVSSMLWIFLGMALLMTFGMLVANRGIVSLTRVPEEAVADAVAYLKICSFGIPFIAGYNGISGILRGLGDSKNPMYFVTCSCGFNIAGDFFLVGALHMGAAGAALATVLAQLLAFIMSVIILQRSEYRLTLSSIQPQRGKVLQVLKLGTPLAAQDFLANLSFLLITIIVNRMGVDKSAAVGVVERIIGFCMLFPIAFLSALSAFTAQNIGAKQPERATLGLRLAITLCALIALVIVGVSELWPEAMVSIFTTDASVIFHGTAYFRTYALDIFMVSFVFCLNGFYSGCGRTGFTMANSLISTFAVRVPLVFAVSLIPDVSLMLIGVAAPAASFVQIIMQLVYYRSLGNSLQSLKL